MVIEGNGMPANLALTVTLGEKPCPITADGRAIDGQITCDKELGEQQYLASSTFFPSCLAVVQADPFKKSGA